MKKLNKFIPLILLTFICVFFLLFILLEKDPGSPPSALIDKQLPDFSTVSLYDENLKPNPISPYAITKLEAEQYLLNNFKDSAWILRFAPVYSENFMLNINRRVKLKGTFYKAGNGNNKLSLCNIKNIKKTVKAIIMHGEINPGIYNISDEKVYTYNYILEKMNSKFILRVPKFIFNILFILGTILNNIFLKENTIKLITNNIFTSRKLGKIIDLNHKFD